MCVIEMYVDTVTRSMVVVVVMDGHFVLSGVHSTVVWLVLL
jgi:hypothetical protein